MKKLLSQSRNSRGITIRRIGTISRLFIVYSDCNLDYLLNQDWTDLAAILESRHPSEEEVTGWLKFLRAALSMEISPTNFTYLPFLQLYRRTQSNISIVNKKMVSIYNVITYCIFGIYHLLQKWIVKIAPAFAPAHIFCTIKTFFKVALYSQGNYRLLFHRILKKN